MNHFAMLITIISITMQLYCCAMEIKLSHTIVNDDYKPTPHLLELLKATHIQHDGTLSGIVAETQKSWLRPAGKERWENETALIIPHDNPSQLFTELALIQEIKPSHQHYDYVMVLGATVTSMRIRLGYLIQLWNNGIRFDSINILAGKRPLDKNIESPEILLHNNVATFPFKENWQLKGELPTTETEMIKLLFDQANLPVEWNNLKINIVDTPMQQSENGALRRPTTRDTIEEWFKLYGPKKGFILAISNQPYIGYQDSVLRNFLPDDFTIETVGNNCITQNVPIILDSLARWIYNEYQISLSQKHT